MMTMMMMMTIFLGSVRCFAFEFGVEAEFVFSLESEFEFYFITSAIMRGGA